MVQRVSTVAFEGIEARAVDVQVQVAPGLPAFAIVGLPDKAVSEARERVRSALIASGLALPARRITVNLAPADLPKEGSHYDLPIALGLMAAIGAIPPDALNGFTVLGELGLDGSLAPVAGVLPAAIGANSRDEGLICPAACGSEAAWASPDIQIIAAHSLIQIANHFKGTQVLSRPQPKVQDQNEAREETLLDLRDIKGQESAKRALEIAAAGGHHLLMIGSPGAGKSMLAARLPSILPPLSPSELLEVSMIASVAGEIRDGALTARRPFRSPHHSASMAALTGGGMRAKPGEISLAHQGVLFLDELPEFDPRVLDSLRQPLENGEVSVSRANHRVTYPARFMLVAAMNPCRCGHAYEPGYSCKRGRLDRCTADYQMRISGPLMDRIDLRIEVPAVTAADLILPPPAEGSAEVAARVAAARDIQLARYAAAGMPHVRTNAEAPSSLLETIAQPDAHGQKLLREAADNMHLTARGYHRVLRVARTLADLDGAETIGRLHLAEALSYRALADDLRRAA
ncbi:MULTISPECIES: YifB family Mg chelatase-like AAA ATPase [Bradyrhizobium]|uniref:ATP-binding protein n=1 Tax=Bradyrhizobium elkanii TaxID=29448 RepID=A0A4U6S1H8_BRAEL|nr:MULTISPECIES: YifB family Mg chelatase-like AAA ATPase [Bradyrhizobium]MTV17555.1 ATP-binding protein [Bradyrhizobium sp. BR2003]TKV81467.1 ATP-binding protein [Bradyrhizobium elkanii]